MWLKLFLDLAGAGLFGVVLLACGTRLRRVLRLPCPPDLSLPVDWALGSLSAGLLALLLGLTGFFEAWALLGGLALLGATGYWRRFGVRLRGSAPFLLVATPLLLVAASPPFFYDAWVYHLGLPWQALLEGRLQSHPENLFSSFPPLAQLLYAYPLSVGMLRVPGCLHLLTVAFASQATSSLARRLGATRGWAFLAGAGLAYLPTAAAVAGLPAADGWAVLGVIGAVSLALRRAAHSSTPALLGLLLGVASAGRLQGLPWAFLLLAAGIFAARNRIGFLVRSATAFVAGSSPWWLKNALLLGTPWVPLGLEGPAVRSLAYRASAALGRDADPAAVALKVTRTLLATPTLLLLAPLTALGIFVLWRNRERRVLWVFGLFVCGIGVWALTGALYRFLTIPLALLSALLVSPSGNAPDRSIQRLAPVVIVLATALWFWTPAATVIPLIGLLVVVLLTASRRPAAGILLAFLMLVPARGLHATARELARLGWSTFATPSKTVFAERLPNNPYPGFVAADALPAGARLLLIGEPRGFLLPRPFVGGSQHDRPLLAALVEANREPRALRDALRDAGFTHLLVNRAELERLGVSLDSNPGYPVLPWRNPEERQRVGELVRLMGPAVIREGSITIYSLEPGAF